MYDTPVGVPVGTHVANLVFADHQTFPAPVGDEWLLLRTAYSNLPDEQAIVGGGNHGGLDPEQVLATNTTIPPGPDAPGPPDPADLVDFGGPGQVDALAGQFDVAFGAVATNTGDLVFSLQGDLLHPPGILYRETVGGLVGPSRAHFHFNNPDAAGDLDDIDGLDYWAPTYPVGGVAGHYSLTGEPGGTSVFAPAPPGPPTAVLTQAQAFAAVVALGFTGAAGDVDIDALMVGHQGDYLFSIRPAANFDGGEIIFLPGSLPPVFLFHGGHFWDTAFNVGAACGLPDPAPDPDYNVDAIEGWPAFAELFGACCFGEDICTIETAEGCEISGGQFRGEGTPCGADGTCIPTVSEWGLVVMGLLVLSAATVVIMRRRAAVA